MVHQATELVHVRTAEDTVTATPNHPFRVAGRGWVAAGELSAGDTLCLADGGRASIVSVTREKLASPVDVYNLEVEDFHTYFVASTGVWVHNCGGGSEAGATGMRRVAEAFAGAEPGSRPGVAMASSEADLARRIGIATSDARVIGGPAGYPGFVFEHADGTAVGVRFSSGYGWTMDVVGTSLKMHHF